MAAGVSGLVSADLKFDTSSHRGPNCRHSPVDFWLAGAGPLRRLLHSATTGNAECLASVDGISDLCGRNADDFAVFPHHDRHARSLVPLYRLGDGLSRGSFNRHRLIRTRRRSILTRGCLFFFIVVTPCTVRRRCGVWVRRCFAMQTVWAHRGSNCRALPTNRQLVDKY